MKQGDLVVRKSYGGDVTFRIESWLGGNALLRGMDYRLLADAPYEDLVEADGALRSEQRSALEQRIGAAMRQLGLQLARGAGKTQTARRGKPRLSEPYFEVPGKVLHIDGDPNYLRKSMALYAQLRVPAEGYFVQESAMADVLFQLLPRVKPDIIVITGHDGLLKNPKDGDINSLSSYKNSQNFANAVRAAREYERNKDSLVIVAGACQSHFEALMQAGANFASSPARVLIHALDPLYVAAKAAFTPIGGTVQITDVLHHTFSGLEGLGGIETRGCFRLGIPKPAVYLNKI